MNRVAKAKNLLVSKTRKDLSLGQYLDFSFNAPVDFLELTNSSTYQHHVSLVISSVYLLTILWQLISRHD